MALEGQAISTFSMGPGHLEMLVKLLGRYAPWDRQRVLRMRKILFQVELTMRRKKFTSTHKKLF